MKILALFYQNPAGYLTSLLLLVFSLVSFAINNNTALIFLAAFVFVLLANILYSVLSFKATRKIQAVLLLTAKLTAENTRRSNEVKYPAGF